MSQFFFTPLSFQAAQNRYRDRLQELDAIAFPDGNQSLLNEDMSPEDADEALVNALESRLHQGTVSGNLTFFAGTFSNGKLNLDGKTVHEMLRSIAENRELLERGIRKRFSGDTVGVIGGILLGCGAGALVWNRLKAAVSQTDITVTRLAETFGDADSSQSLITDNSQFFIISALIVALAVILVVVFLAKKAGKRSPSLIEDKIPDKERALEVLTLAECLADIYRDERD